MPVNVRNTSSSDGRATEIALIGTPSSANSRGTNASPLATPNVTAPSRIEASMWNVDASAAIAALAARFQLEAHMREGAVTFGVANGEAFVPRLFAELGVPIKAISVARPSLDDVFLTFTGMTIRDREASALEQAGVGRNRRRG